MRSILAFLLLLSACGGGTGPIPEASAAESPGVIAVFGDSITTGMMPHEGVVQLRQDLSYTSDLVAVGKVVTAAAGGASTADAAGLQLTRLKPLSPKHVVIMLGTNDALRGFTLEASKLNVIKIAETYRSARIVLVSPPYWDKLASSWLEAWNLELKTLAKDRGWLWVNVYGASVNEWQCSADDHHPCENAHRAMGRLIADAIRAS